MPSSKGFRTAKGDRTPDAVALGDILQGLMQRKEFRAGAGLGRLMSRWEDVVGERLAQETVPLSLERGTLAVGASSGAWAAQVGFLSEEIRRKACEELGAESIREVRVTVRKPV